MALRVPGPSPAKFGRPSAPFIAPTSGDLDQRLAQIADAINRKADRETPDFFWIKLVSPNGTTYAVSVDDNGALHTTQVLRS